MVGETIGSFITVFFYLTQTEQRTSFSKEKSINCFIIAAAYIAGRSMVQGQRFDISNPLSAGGYSVSGAVLNPAIAIGTTITMLIKTPDACANNWIFVCLPFAGALIAVLFHEFFFKKTYEAIDDADDKDDNNDNLLDN